MGLDLCEEVQLDFNLIFQGHPSSANVLTRRKNGGNDQIQQKDKSLKYTPI
jgi:hypothetical protein